MNKLTIKEVSKSYDCKNVLKDISFTVNEYETVAILGPNGCGKTTLFNIIAGLDSPDSGTILIDDINITNTQGNVSYMPQNDLLLPYKTIIQNVSLPLILNGTSKRDAYSAVKKYFNIFLERGTENKYPHELSGGMKQRAAFLRTYMYSKDILILDEQFSALDQITKNTMYSWFLDIINTFKKTTVFITHNIEEAILLADTIYIFSSKTHGIINNINTPKDKKRDFLFSLEFINYKKEITDMLGLS